MHQSRSLPSRMAFCICHFEISSGDILMTLGGLFFFVILITRFDECEQKATALQAARLKKHPRAE